MKKEKYLETILTICTGLMVLFYLFGSKYLLAIAIVLGLIGLFIRKIAEWITWAWTKLSEGLGFISSKIILTTIFYVIVYPISLLYRMGHKDSLKLKNNYKSLFKDRNHNYSDQDLEHMW